MSIELPDLPYAEDALEPHVSAQTLSFHYGKHHKAYVDKLNAAIGDSQYAGEALEKIITLSHAAGDGGVFNNAAQAWNHTFLWHSMSPQGGGSPEGALADAIQAGFGDLATFKEKFKASAMGQFGSGWTWLVLEAGKLDILSTANAETPLTDGKVPLLTLDVWEHAYYLDYQNQRDRYVDTFLGELINWDFAAQIYAANQAT
jgi:Fe-Mn family superoxide dismutase